MLRGQKIGLRARQESDVPVLHEELYNDVPMRARADTRPWRPIPLGTEASPFAVREPDDRFSSFSVVTLEDGELAGSALLWGIDNHNRSAHLGMALRPSHRGRGLSSDVVRVLCRYGFAVRGLQRLQLETLADNEPMIRSAERAGFTREGTLRRAAWVDGQFLDEVILGLLAGDWQR
ncbi:GNAT family N-acetyltransferase [Streptacidiphilus sp. 4-A2]|nr:GNAT family N-acetyltransferase [Streptacidiphilus sp. 4-A2]